MAMLESDYTHANSPKPAPEVPVRVFLKSQLMAALRQHSRPIIIGDLDLALPFIRMLRARELRLRAVGGLVAEAMSYAINRYYSAHVEAHWYIGQYVLPGNVQRVILKPKALPLRTLDSGASAHSARCFGTDATLQRFGSSSACIPKAILSFGSVIDPRRELCARATSGK